MKFQVLEALSLTVDHLWSLQWNLTQNSSTVQWTIVNFNDTTDILNDPASPNTNWYLAPSGMGPDVFS